MARIFSCQWVDLIPTLQNEINYFFKECLIYVWFKRSILLFLHTFEYVILTQAIWTPAIWHLITGSRDFFFSFFFFFFFLLSRENIVSEGKNNHT